MKQLDLKVTAAVGLHARPAAALVQTAMAYQADIFVVKDTRKVSAKSLLSVLSLGIKAGESVAIHADGVDETEALAAISQLADNHFGEPAGKEV